MSTPGMCRVEPVLMVCGWVLFAGADLCAPAVANDASINTLTTGLSETEQALGTFDRSVYDAGTLGGGQRAWHPFPSLAADPRVHQLLAEYDRMPPEAACRRTQALWQHWSKVHVRHMVQVMDEWKASGAHNISVGLRDSNYACTAALLLMTRYGTDEDLNKALMRWQVARDSIVGGSAGPDLSAVVSGGALTGLSAPSSIHDDAGPDDLLVFNLCLTRIRNSRDPKAGRLVVHEQIDIDERATVTRLATSTHPSADVAGAAMDVHYVLNWRALIARRRADQQHYMETALNALRPRKD